MFIRLLLTKVDLVEDKNGNKKTTRMIRFCKTFNLSKIELYVDVHTMLH